MTRFDPFRSLKDPMDDLRRAEIEYDNRHVEALVTIEGDETVLFVGRRGDRPEGTVHREREASHA